MADPSSPRVQIVGSNPTTLWGLTMDERLRRIARDAALGGGDGAASGACLLVSALYAFDHQWLRFMAARPGTVLTVAGRPVMSHLPPELAPAVEAAMADDEKLPADVAATIVRAEDHRVFYNAQLRKREEPFLERLEPGTVRSIERQSYFGAYKGVTDLLTKYLWPEWALVLTRLAARMGISPNGVTAVGAILCVVATFLFAQGRYWEGIAAGLGFMVLDTVDGKLARCTLTSSRWGNIFDHGIDLIHPPFWWYAWGVGLEAWGLPLGRDTFWLVMVAIVGGYVVQRVIEGIFMRRYGIHIHVWEKVDSDFRLITARRNPNMVLLFASLLAGRPDWGLIAVAVWTILSLLFHAVRLAQATARRVPVVSWLTVDA